MQPIIMEWLEIKQVVTLVLLVVSEALGISPVKVNGLVDALFKFYQVKNRSEINASS